MQRVQIRMNPNAGVIGEDRSDWLGGEVHACTPHFARQLVTRGLAQIITAPHDTIAHGDPVVEHRDPVGLTTSSFAGPSTLADAVDVTVPDAHAPDALDTETDPALVKPPAPPKKSGRR